ncbi:hypothetical protein B0H12DRAFT_842741 [Mycena haematopus]|nr:hypothetical protein B0H12DRAFT_842741 [Mycena haematopus]
MPRMTTRSRRGSRLLYPPFHDTLPSLASSDLDDDVDLEPAGGLVGMRMHGRRLSAEHPARVSAPPRTDGHRARPMGGGGGGSGGVDLYTTDGVASTEDSRPVAVAMGRYGWIEWDRPRMGRARIEGRRVRRSASGWYLFYFVGAEHFQGAITVHPAPIL